MAAGDLYALCREFLQASADALLDAPAGPIDRAFVSPGPPAWDCCPQLTVHAGGPAPADTEPLAPPLQPGHRIQDGVLLNLVTMTATVIRCTPTVPEGSTGFPDAADLDASAEELLGDVWAIWNHIATLKRAGSLWGPKTREVFFDPAVALNAAGGCAGWQMQVRVQLDGYRTTP
jgi:hypothetical protein